jgi:predicted RNase H-like HicB family nuclease
MMKNYFPAVVEQESNGSWSAWVPGLPGVYAAADTKGRAKWAIRRALAAHLDALAHLGQSAKPKAELLVLRSSGKRLDFAGIGALMGRSSSVAKARASRLNGRKGGRPRLHA